MDEAVQPEGIILAPGNVFSPGEDSRWDSFLRFNVAQSLDPRIHHTLKTVLGHSGARLHGL